MTVRTKVLLLLSSVLVFFAGASATSLFVRGRAADALTRAAERDVRMLTMATHVTAAHLEQAIRLERALRHSRDRGDPDAQLAYERAKAEYETYSAEIWNQLQEAEALARIESDSPDAGAERASALLERIDAEHNAYAEEARHTFALLESDRRSEALAWARRLARDEDRLQHALGALLVQVSSVTENASTQARRDEQWASWIVGSLLGAGFLLTISAFVTVVRLVSEMKSLGGLLPICAHCKKIRDDRGYWNQLEAYLMEHSEAEFTHGICAECQAQMHAQIKGRRARGADAPALS